MAGMSAAGVMRMFLGRLAPLCERLFGANATCMGCRTWAAPHLPRCLATLAAWQGPVALRCRLLRCVGWAGQGWKLHPAANKAAQQRSRSCHQKASLLAVRLLPSSGCSACAGSMSCKAGTHVAWPLSSLQAPHPAHRQTRPAPAGAVRRGVAELRRGREGSGKARRHRLQRARNCNPMFCVVPPLPSPSPPLSGSRGIGTGCCGSGPARSPRWLQRRPPLQANMNVMGWGWGRQGAEGVALGQVGLLE